MKKIGLLLIVFVLLLTSGCTSSQESSKVKDGSYQTVVKGHNGDMTITTVFNGEKIEGITVDQHVETIGVSDSSIAQIPLRIVESQSIAVDLISGATVTSQAIITGVTNAILEAGGDLENYNKKSDDVVKKDVVYETDVVIIGSGIAGVTAAVSAQENGANVIMLEKMGKTGGTTALSGGMILATNSFLQDGFDDSAMELSNYWYERSQEVANKEMLDFAANESANTIQWLADNGVEFKEEVTTSGLTTDKRAIVTTTRGAGFIDPVIETFTNNGGELFLETKALSLIIDENGNVIGVSASNATENITINAKSVVLASGGFDANADMVSEYAPRANKDLVFSNVGNTGDGILMGMDVGADTVFPGSVIGFRGLASNVAYYTPMGLLGLSRNLVVDLNGNRFYDESLDYSLIYDLWDQKDVDQVYAIFDSAVTNPALEDAVKNGYALKADTIEELATLLSANELKNNVDRYNSLIVEGVDSDFNKSINAMSSIETGPFYAVTINNGTLGSFGGLKIDMDAQVLNTDGNKIGGLYASGEVANGEWFNQFYPASGSSISISATFGIEAGENAALNALNEK